MKASNKALELIKESEGLRLNAYRCSAGVLTIGYGHTKDVREGLRITEPEAETLLKMDLVDCESAVNKFVKVQLNQNQFDALVDFVFNFGETKFRLSTLLKKLNDGNYKEASEEFLRWNKAFDPKKKVYVELAGLTKRRTKEKELFLM